MPRLRVDCRDRIMNLFGSWLNVEKLSDPPRLLLRISQQVVERNRQLPLGRDVGQQLLLARPEPALHRLGRFRGTRTRVRLFSLPMLEAKDRFFQGPVAVDD